MSFSKTRMHASTQSNCYYATRSIAFVIAQGTRKAYRINILSLPVCFNFIFIRYNQYVFPLYSLEVMRRQYISQHNITDINFIVINAGDLRSRLNYYRLYRLGYFDLYQDYASETAPEENVWSLLDGAKDDFLIYDRQDFIMLIFAKTSCYSNNDNVTFA